MNSETRQCQNCKQTFAIEPADFDFYKKIKVPAPTFCFDCRLQRKMSWRNERGIYRRKCDAPGHTEEILSMYDPAKPYKVFDSKFWWGDGWDALASGQDYDFSKPFFVQYDELLKRTPALTLSNLNSVNSDYANFTDNNKNCYWVFGVGWCENVSYAAKSIHNKDSMDILSTNKSELCYESINCSESYHLFYSNNCKNCTNSSFLYSCRDCTDCFGCSNLVSKSYCIFNKQYTKEEYVAKMKEFQLGDYASLQKIKKQYEEEVYLKAIHRYSSIIASVGCTGDGILNSKNCQHSFDIYNSAEDSKYLYHSANVKDSYDGMGIFEYQLGYELIDSDKGESNTVGMTVYASNNAQYSFNCHACSDIFGCTGLRNKKYCILNKQYTKEEYTALLPKVIEHMGAQPYADSKGRIHRYGDFFPIEISPFAYNETIAQEYFNLSDEQGAQAGYPWKKVAQKDYVATIQASALPSSITEVSGSILKEVVACEHGGTCRQQCTKAFKITPLELSFYKANSIPLPRLCPNCRHNQRLVQKKPLRVWPGNCHCFGIKSKGEVYSNSVAHAHGDSRCPNTFETPYSPSRPEIVYCEQCYQAEVA